MKIKFLANITLLTYSIVGARQNRFIFIDEKNRNSMRRIKLSEEQFLDFKNKVKESEVRQKISKMRNDTSDMKQGELKQLAHRFIDLAFWLGIKYYKMKTDIDGRARIMKKLDGMNKQIDGIPF